MMNKERLSHIVVVVSFVVLIVLGLACANAPSTQIDLGVNYRGMLQSPTGNERAIDSVGFRGNTSFVCRDTSHNITPSQQLGATYQLGGQTVTRSQAAQAAAPAAERHRHEPILDQLLNQAKSIYPNEAVPVNIRNARTLGHNSTNPRSEQYTESVRRSDGTYANVTRTRTVWDCFPFYVANVITTEPMPQALTHSENFQKPGSTRADIYRWAINWIEDNTQRRRLTVQSENIDRGRIQGTIRCFAQTDRSYFVTSNYTIDVYDARVEMRFTDTFLQRTDPSGQNVGNPEPIFLQSIYDAARVELVDFATSLRSAILAR